MVLMTLHMSCRREQAGQDGSQSVSCRSPAHQHDEQNDAQREHVHGRRVDAVVRYLRRHKARRPERTYRAQENCCSEFFLLQWTF